MQQAPPVGEVRDERSVGERGLARHVWSAGLSAGRVRCVCLHALALATFALMLGFVLCERIEETS